MTYTNGNISMAGHCETEMSKTVVLTTTSVLLLELGVAIAVWAWRQNYIRPLWTCFRGKVASTGKRIKRKLGEENSRLIQDKIHRLNIDNNETVYALRNTIDEKDAAVTERDRTIHQQADDIQRLRTQLREESAAKHQALTRLSEVAAARLTDNNPAVVDLSDAFRPTRLGEMMSGLYDDQWTSAYSVLEDQHGPRPDDGREYVEILLSILLTVFRKCSEISEQRMGAILQNYCSETADVPREIRKRIKDDRKKLAQLALPRIKQVVIAELKATMATPVDLFHHQEVRDYADQCVHICWMMCVQDPPMALTDTVPESSRYNPAMYREYTCRGPYVAYSVWPAVLIQTGGDIVTKGIVQCYKSMPARDPTQLQAADVNVDVDDNSLPTNSWTDVNIV